MTTPISSVMLESQCARLQEYLNEGVLGTARTNTNSVIHAINAYEAEVGCAAERAINPSKFSSKEMNTHEQGLRISQLGKPAVIQACNSPLVKQELMDLGFSNHRPENLRMMELLHRGHQWEAWVKLLISIADPTGWIVKDEQKEVEFCRVPGHIDFILETPHGDMVCEVKTMSSQYFNSFVREPNDERGYLTQLAIYSHTLGLPGCFICLDKGTHNVAVVPINTLKLQDKLDRAEFIASEMRDVKNLESVFAVFSPPPPVSEVFRKQNTGRQLVPPCMKYENLRHLFYNISVQKNGYDKDTEYVVGYRTYEEALEFLGKQDQLQIA